MAEPVDSSRGLGLASRPVPLSWFTKSTLKYTPLLAETMVIAIVLRLLGLVEPFVFQAIIDRVLPFHREATLILIVIVLTTTTIFSALLGVVAATLTARQRQIRHGVAATCELGRLCGFLFSFYSKPLPPRPGRRRSRKLGRAGCTRGSRNRDERFSHRQEIRPGRPSCGSATKVHAPFDLSAGF
ncbi:hypothetical protein SAMN03159448_04020 [Sinorhizobium sp. NFACC03]|nr:hypothetical protein [Sinorhizobium sp. NFACC03]SDA87760.1 hypothetical protein SAMN03159448_04020 [Sinorhizobium sp. NFACC03]